MEMTGMPTADGSTHGISRTMPSVTSRARGLSFARGNLQGLSNRPLGGQYAGEHQLVERVGIMERPNRYLFWETAAKRLRGFGVRGQGLTRQGQGRRQGFDSFAPPLRRGFPKGLIAIKRNRSTHAAVRSILPPLMLDEDLVIEQTPPEDHLLPDGLLVHLIPGAVDRYLGIGADGAALGFSGDGAESLPDAHLADPCGGEIGEPILDSGMRLRAVRLLVIAEQEVHQPGIRLLLVLGRMKVIERLVALFDRSERPLHFAFGPTGHPASPLSPRHVAADFDVQIPHDAVEELALGDGPMVQVEHMRPAPEEEPLDRFRDHRPKEEAQRRGDVLAVDDVILPIGHPAAIVHDAIQHQDRVSPACVDPGGWLRERFEIRGTDIKLPAFVDVRGLEVDHRLLDGQRALVITPPGQIPVHGSFLGSVLKVEMDGA